MNTINIHTIDLVKREKMSKSLEQTSFVVSGDRDTDSKDDIADPDVSDNLNTERGLISGFLSMPITSSRFFDEKSRTLAVSISSRTSASILSK